nr:hypothetical protein [Priestia megaterium]MDH3144440.1 hypothetical protein [Priestia megaterium]
MIQTKDFKIPAVVESIKKDAKEVRFAMSCDNETATLLRTLASSKRNSKFLELGTGAGLSTMLGLKSFRTAKAIISGIEVMHMIKKKQVYQEVKSAPNQVRFIHQLFGIAS